MDNVSKQEASEKKGLLKQLAAALGLSVVEKGSMAELYEERSKGTLFWNAFNSLEEVLYSYDNITGRWNYETNEEKVRECLEDFNSIITSILTGKESITKAIQTDRPERVEKAGKKMSGKNKEMLTGIYESLGTFLKEFDEPEKDPGEGDDGAEDTTKTKKEDKEVTKQEVTEIVEKAITKAMGAAVKKADDTTDPKKKEDAGTDAGAAATEEEKTEEVKKSEEITPDTIEKMVEAAIEKAMQPQESVTAEQVQEMITAAVAKAVDPVLKSKGLPSNLGSNVEKAAGEEHYLHGIL